MLLRRDCKRLGDIAAATLVVHEPRTAGADDGARQGAAARAGARRSRREDQAALIALAARAPRLTAERLDELAALAAVGLRRRADAPGPEVTRRVLGVAQWALGRR